jgi:hypothetical protein
MTMRIALTAHVSNTGDHSEAYRFFSQQTFVVNCAPDMSPSTGCQWLDANI